MATELDAWLDQATRCLASKSAARVRTEIREHYEAARATALGSGITPEEADRRALAALGDAESTNRAYRKTLLTSAEERVLRQGNWEAQTFCVKGQARVYAAALTLAAVAACATLYLTGHVEIAHAVMAPALCMSILALFIILLTLAPRLPIYTRSRGRIVRYVKWTVLMALPLVALGHDTAKYSWLFIGALLPAVYTERQRAQIRRKLPISDWPKHLYL